MTSSLPEELQTYAEFCPDNDARLKLHYYFVHRFMAWYVHDNPFNFVMHDGVDPTRFIQARLAVQAQNVIGRVGPPPHHLFRRVSDLEAWTQEVAGHAALFVQLPAPETFGHAFFAAGVLLARAESFHRLEESFVQFVKTKGTTGMLGDTDGVRKARARFFTLERTMNFESEQAQKMGRFCEWTAEKEHLNSGVAVPVTREKFAEVVARACHQGEHIRAVASHRPGDNHFPSHHHGVPVTLPPPTVVAYSPLPTNDLFQG